MAKNNDRTQRGILGDINPNPSAQEHIPTRSERGTSDEGPSGSEEKESMTGGSRHDRSEHAGARDITEGVTGGTGTEVGGTRNYRQGTGATGTDIGNRPE